MRRVSPPSTTSFRGATRRGAWRFGSFSRMPWSTARAPTGSQTTSLARPTQPRWEAGSSRSSAEPNLPGGVRRVRTRYESTIYNLEIARQRFAAEAAGRGDGTAALLAKMIEQVEARRDGAAPDDAAALDHEAQVLSNGLWSGTAPDAVKDIVTTSDNLTKILKKLDRVGVPAADHDKALERARAMAASDPAQAVLVVDRGFDDKGLHRGFVVTAMPPCFRRNASSRPRV